MPQPFRESLKPLARQERTPLKERLPKGVIRQEDFERSRGRKVSWKPKP